jgi:glycerophosphoryl diester phosphodiesterase
MPKEAYFDGPRPLAFAHRGGARAFPENTLMAFQGAIELGFRHIETDVHLTRDGEIVCFHDDRLERTTDGRGLLRDRTLAELKALDAAHHFTIDGITTPLRGTGVTIPTFEEALALHPAVKWNVEIKPKSERAMEAVVSFLETRGLEERVLVAAADDATNARIRRRIGGRFATSPGIREVFFFWLRARLGLAGLVKPGFDALQVPPSHGPLTVVDRRFVDAAHAHGVQVHVWTIDDPDEMRRLAELGVDGLMTDEPALLLATLDRLSGRVSRDPGPEGR